MFALFYVYVLKIKINIVMKRKILTLLLAIVASVEIHAEIIYIVEGDLSYKLNTQSKVVEVEKYHGLSPVGVIEILPSVTYKNVTYNVTGISNFGFLNCNRITEVIIPNSIVRIGEAAFEGCSNMTSITIPNSVTSIGDWAFSGCSSMDTIVFSSSVSSVGKAIFYNCNSLNAIEVDIDNPNFCSLDGVLFNKDKTTIVAYPRNKTGAYAIPNSVIDIEGYAFDKCYGLTAVTIPNNVINIGEYAFSSCSALSSVTIGDNVAHIGGYAFSGCTNLTSIVIPRNVTKIESWAFQNCTNIIDVVWNAKSCDFCNFGSQVESFTFGNDVDTIPASLCADMTNLVTIVIPEGVKCIEDNAFQNCMGLTNVTIPNSIMALGNSIFSGCTNLESVTLNSDSIVSQNHSTYSNISTIFGTQVQKYLIGDAVSYIGSFAFYGCSSLTNIKISSSVDSIGEYAFYNCSSLDTIDIKGNSIISIGKYAFRNCHSLHSIKIPNSVKEIRQGTFYGCYNLESISIPYGITSIENETFYNCNNLTSITIPKSIEEIANNAFEYCNIDQIHYTGNINDWIRNPLNSIPFTLISNSYDLYIDDEKIVNLVVPNNVDTINNYSFYGCRCLMSVEIPSSVVSIGNLAFGNCDNMTRVILKSNELVSKAYSSWDINANLSSLFGSQVKEFEIGDGVTSIGDYTFWWGDKIESIIISDDVVSIGKHAFDNCLLLTTINLKNGLKSIGDDAFYGCTGLSSINIPNSVVKIGDRAFSACSNITSITLGNNIKSIGTDAFNIGRETELYFMGSIKDWCDKPWNPWDVALLGYTLYLNNQKISNVVIPDDVTSIGYATFLRCKNLTTITLPATVTSVEQMAFDAPNLSAITCFATTPPTYVGENNSLCEFDHILLYVPYESINAYRTAPEWKYFYFNSQILPIGAAPTDVNNTTIIPGDNFVEIMWQFVAGAATYELIIKDNGGNIICTLIFNAEGQLLTIEYRAPGRNRVPQSTQSAGFAYTITGLDSGSAYSYTLTAKNSSGGVLNTESGSFSTSGGATGVDNIVTDKHNTKVLRNGQIYIHDGDKTYTLQGQKVK